MTTLTITLASQPRPRGRKRRFDAAAALERAVALFWERGCDGVSIADLTAVTGIAAPSLYAAFGSKEKLYRRALGQYLVNRGARTTRALGQEPTALAAATRVLREPARESTDRHRSYRIREDRIRIK
ncbi:MAG: helix-turn-helix domain containing protein [Isosphaeraceae bacterium]|nr:helix-turn-helix domain containing protein [Isosphaeraceae bacterium]